MLSLKRAQEIKSVFLNEIEQTRTIPARLVQPFWEFYRDEFRPGKFAGMPCTCQPKTWIQMVEEVKNEVNEVLSSVNEQPSEAVMEEPNPKPLKKKVTAVAGVGKIIDNSVE